MKVKLLTGLSGPKYTLSPGDVTDRFGKKEAQRLIDAGIAEEYTDPPPLPDPEKAVAEALTARDAEHSAALTAKDAEHAAQIQQLQAEHQAAVEKAVAEALAAKANEGK